MNPDVLRFGDNQNRLRDAANCPTCRQIWSTFSDQFCSSHSEAGWLARIQTSQTGHNEPGRTTPVHRATFDPILQEHNTVSLEETRLDLGLSHEQLRVALKLLEIVAQFETGSARIRIVDEEKLRAQFKPFRHRHVEPTNTSQSQAEEQIATPQAPPSRRLARKKFVLPSTTNCENANFDGCEMEGLAKADFSGYIFKRASFRNCLITGVRFDELNLKGVRFTNSILKDCRFRRTDLSKAKFDSTTIVECDFYGARIVKATFRRSQVRADFVRVFAPEVDFGDVEFGECDFSEANLQKASFSSSDIRQLNFAAADLKWANLNLAKFEQTQFSDTQIESTVAIQPAETFIDRQHFKQDGSPKKALSEFTAKVALSNLRSLGDRNASIYKCMTCGMWHVGH